jgi:hypothetical protein
MLTYIFRPIKSYIIYSYPENLGIYLVYIRKLKKRTNKMPLIDIKIKRTANKQIVSFICRN